MNVALAPRIVRCHCYRGIPAATGYNDNLRCTKLAAADAALARVERKRAELQKHRDGVMAGGAPAAAAADHLDSGDMLPEGWVDAATPAPSMLSGILDSACGLWDSRRPRARLHLVSPNLAVRQNCVQRC